MTRPVAKLEQLSYYPRLCERVRELAAEGWRAGQIAEILNEEGYRPPLCAGRGSGHRGSGI